MQSLLEEAAGFISSVRPSACESSRPGIWE